eukprot:scaffold124064_cov30-Tisochrysis_lutea.AAC.1
MLACESANRLSLYHLRDADCAHITRLVVAGTKLARRGEGIAATVARSCGSSSSYRYPESIDLMLLQSTGHVLPQEHQKASLKNLAGFPPVVVTRIPSRCATGSLRAAPAGCDGVAPEAIHKVVCRLPRPPARRRASRRVRHQCAPSHCEQCSDAVRFFARCQAIRQRDVLLQQLSGAVAQSVTSALVCEPRHACGVVKASQGSGSMPPLLSSGRCVSRPLERAGSAAV